MLELSNAISGDIDISYSNLFSFANYLLTAIGSWFLFKKCGVKGIWAIIPVAREYHVSLCADKEKEGRVYTIVSLLFYLLYVITGVFVLFNPMWALFMVIPLVGVYVTLIIYMLKIYLGLIKVFDRKKKWLILFMFFEGITLFWWGVSSRFVPGKKVEQISKNGAKELGENLTAAAEGLTINIADRTVIDFFKKKTLLKDIHLIIPRGHMVLLLGGSGAGKTTFLNAVTGYEKAKASIKLDNNDVYSDYDKMKYDIGFVPQQDLMRGNDTVEMTLTDAALMRLSADASVMERENRIANMLDQFGLTAVRNSLVEKLSGGQRKRLSIAIEFISDPSLFILDEPDSGLDGVVARSLFEKLREIADDGKIVVVITHTPDRVIDLFDDVIVLAKDATRTGRLAWYGPVDEAYEFFGKDSMEEILLSINQKDEGGEGRADEFVEKYADRIKEKVG
ncbi:ATP-binding cassette domain-containing protein [Butyrivibrio sp. XPD2006]|uniref:ATP-binding cassette domain-containing protein n=1 Tax=Butyrivibrio sp. XPD2006 TaxID=1280668 RepID=UPI0003B4AFEC|nr:ABC transporter ATP-binding protein [Butyrivibrio sp. XPD2006]